MNKVLKDTRTMVLLGLMLAITMILDLTPLGAIPMGTVVATIAHVPTIIVGIVLGPVAGLISGISLGLISLFHALLRPASPFSLLFINPLISVLPRMFIGVASYYAYTGTRQLFKMGRANPVAIGIGAAAGSITNTVLVLGMLSLVHGQKIVDMLASAGIGTSVAVWAVGVALSNGVMEAVVSVVLIVAIVTVYLRTNRE